MALGGSPTHTRPLNRQLWQKFVHIAQPYFYPMVRGGGWITLLLIVMLLVLVFALLLLCVAAVTLVGHRLNPTLTEAVAPGLYLTLHSLLDSPGVLLVIASLVIPIGCFLALGRHMRPRWQQWALLVTVLFLCPYMVLGSLRAQLLYPAMAHAMSEAALRQVLEQVNLAELPDRVGGLDVELDWADVLSLGEQQRVAFARLLLTKPEYAVLDEATSALDVPNEERLYRLLQAAEMTYVSVGHRPSMLQYHQYVLDLTGAGHWRLLPVATYMLEASASTS